MSKTARCAILFVGLICLGVAAGCRRNGGAQKLIDSALKQPLAAEVMRALDNHEYDKVVPAWVQARMSATNEEQRAQISILTQEIKLKLYDPATTNTAAAAALQTMNMMSSGR